jgi:hypothetical protein
VLAEIAEKVLSPLFVREPYLLLVTGTKDRFMVEFGVTGPLPQEKCHRIGRQQQQRQRRSGPSCAHLSR